MNNNLTHEEFQDIIFDWWNDFDNPDETKTFDKMFEEWSQVILLPSFKEVDYALNNMAVSRKKFTDYFNNIFNENQKLNSQKPPKKKL